MDKLLVRTTEGPDNTFTTQWQWFQQNAKHPVAGEIVVRLHESFRDDRPIIAELGAIHYLLEERRIHGRNRLGSGITIEVTFGAIRKALLKGALKKTDQGDTEKTHVAGCASFLATKYFEADVNVCRKWRMEEPKSFERAEIDIGESFPRAKLHCHLLGEDVLITRHAMRRQIARLDKRNPAKPDIHDENDLSHVPDKWWGTAWRWFANIFKEGSNLRQVRLLPKWHNKYLQKYGRSIYLWHPDSGGVIILARDHGNLYVATVIHDEYAAIEKDPVQVGQKVVPHHLRPRTKAFA
jgi:hypothetical protein